MLQTEIWYVREMVVRCTCGTILHVERKRFCCGIDWALKYSEMSGHFLIAGKLSFPVTPVIPQPPKKPKTRRRTTPLTQETREMVLDRDGHECVRCHSATKLQVHHIWHRKFGGGNDLGNLETLCLECHIQEHKSEPIAKVMKKSLLEHA